MILAAITPTPAAPPPDPLAGLRDNAPLVEVPWPTWAWWAIGAGAVVIIALLVWLGIWLARRKVKTPPPSPRAIALRELEALRAKVAHLEPYAFSVAVSDVLRTYISAHFNLHATQQTSPEFLTIIATSARFTDDDRRLLAAFLERCDLLKFARVEVGSDENSALLQAATAFVQGAQT
jgi:hypothetical protein